MLANLRIENFAIIEDIDINFSKGMNVLMGETGAGKSIIIDALDLLSGWLEKGFYRGKIRLRRWLHRKKRRDKRIFRR